MILALRGKVAGGVDVLRDAVGGELDGGKGIAQALFDQADGKVGDVDANPLPTELFRRMDGGAAVAERVEHHIAGVRRGVEDALKEGDRFSLGWRLRRSLAAASSKCKGPAEAGPRDVDKI